MYTLCVLLNAFVWSQLHCNAELLEVAVQKRVKVVGENVPYTEVETVDDRSTYVNDSIYGPL